MNKTTLIIIGLLIILIALELQKRVEQFISKHDITLALKTLNSIKPKSMKKIKMSNLSTHLMDIRDVLETNLSPKLVAQYNELTSFKDVYKFIKENRNEILY